MYRKKTTVIIVMCIAILFMAVGYALLSTKLNINGSTAVISNWKVEFSAIRTIGLRGGATNVTTPSYTSTTATFNVDLVMPGDEVTYEIDITNYGETKAEVKSASYVSTDSDVIYVYIENIRKGTIIEACTDQSACPTVSMKVVVGYSKNSDSVLVDETKTIDLSLEIGQYIEGSPTEDGELVPELSRTLVDQILNYNYVNSESTIDLTKASSYPTQYKENHSTETVRNCFYEYSGPYKFGTTYQFDKSSGLYYLTGDIVTSISSTTFLDHPYACMNGTCTTLFNISSYDSNSSSSSISCYYGYDYTISASSIFNENGNGLYVSTDTNDGRPTYYFRGDVNNNYVEFANRVWQIIRINEDGTVRVIADEATEAAGEFEEDYISHQFSCSWTDVLEEVYYSNSCAKNTMINWYNTNLINYDEYIATSTFCEQAKVSDWSSNLTLGNTTMTLLYNYSFPTFKCQSDGNGHGLITNQKIGFISLDEVLYAGGDFNYNGVATSGKYYLSGKNYNFWTISTSTDNNSLSSYAPYYWTINKNGEIESKLGVYGWTETYNPVINLKSDLIVIGGNGTKEKPYKLGTN